MATSQTAAPTGPTAWTRLLAGDLFPGVALPFAWTVLRAPAERALRRALVALGAGEPAASPLWRLADDRRVYVNADALAEAARQLHGAAWLGELPGEPPAGLLARWQTGGVIRQAQARVAQALTEVAGLHVQVAQWLAWVRGLHWTQADLLQVMEEVEPKAQAALETYFILRAGLAAAGQQVAKLLADWLPERPPDVQWGLYVGLEGLPGVEAAYTLAVAARDEPSSAAALVRFGHRGPGEMAPDGERWGDEPELMADLALHRPARNHDTARIQRQAVEAWVFGQLKEGQGRQFEAVLRAAQDLSRAADIAWDGVIMIVAAAQAWLGAVAQEARAVGVVASPSDTFFMELEELKQVATGEWHGGRSDQIRTEVSRRRTSPAAAAGEAAEDRPAPASPGQARGPAYLASPAVTPPPPGAIWVAEQADAGCAAFWLSAGALALASADPWSPGVIVARSLGVPVVIGVRSILASVQPGQLLAVDGDTGQVGFSSVV